MWRILDDLLFRPKKAIKIILLIAGLVVVLVLAANAVVDPDRTLVFEEKMVLNYGSEDNTISLIKTIGGKDVKKEDINKEKNSRKYGEVVRSTGPGHPLRAYHRPAVLLAVLHEPHAVRQ